MIPQLFLYVILTVTPPMNGHCGQEVRAPSYSPVRIGATDLRLNGLGELVNRKPIKFSAAKQDWGVIEGFCVLDSRGEVVSVGHLNHDKRVSAGDKGPELDITIPEVGAEKLKKKLLQDFWWISDGRLPTTSDQHPDYKPHFVECYAINGVPQESPSCLRLALPRQYLTQ